MAVFDAALQDILYGEYVPELSAERNEASSPTMGVFIPSVGEVECRLNLQSFKKMCRLLYGTRCVIGHGDPDLTLKATLSDAPPAGSPAGSPRPSLRFICAADFVFRRFAHDRRHRIWIAKRAEELGDGKNTDHVNTATIEMDSHYRDRYAQRAEDFLNAFIDSIFANRSKLAIQISHVKTFNSFARVYVGAIAVAVNRVAAALQPPPLPPGAPPLA